MGNWVDFLFFIFIIYFLLTSKGLIDAVIEIIDFILSLVIAYQVYTWVGKLLILYFNLPRGIATAAGFFIAWSICETFLHLVLMMISWPILRRYREHDFNKYLGYIAGAGQGVLFFFFFVSLVFALPVRGKLKSDILNSYSGPFFVDTARTTEQYIKQVFGGLVSETINFLTIKPHSDERVQLDFTAHEDSLVIDSNSEEEMLTLVNKERNSRGISTLEADPELQVVAREYAKTMLVNGFFSHVSAVDGTGPAERAERHGIMYTVLGENLAYAPDVYIAHQGLMNSEGHRKNILSPDYGRVGIGVIDAGIYGRMFVQMFRNP